MIMGYESFHVPPNWTPLSPCPDHYTYISLLQCGFVKDIVHSDHLGKNSAIAEGVSQCSQPGSDLAMDPWVCANVEVVRVMH